MQQAREIAQRMKRLSLTRARARTVHLSWSCGTSPWISIAQVRFTTRKRRLVRMEPRYKRTLERGLGKKKKKKQLNHTVLESYFTILQSHQDRGSPSKQNSRHATKFGHSRKFQWLYWQPKPAEYLSELLSSGTSCVSGPELPGLSSDSRALILQIGSVARALH